MRYGKGRPKEVGHTDTGHQEHERRSESCDNGCKEGLRGRLDRHKTIRAFVE